MWWGLTDGDRKTTGIDNRVLPASIVYDAELLTTLPAEMAVASGLNALAHCVDAMWGPRVDPIDQVFAVEGIRALAAGLPAVAQDPSGVPGVEETLYGAYLAAVAFASAGSGCTTRSATSSAECSTCRTRRPTRSCCPTSWRSTPRTPPPRSVASLTPSGGVGHRRTGDAPARGRSAFGSAGYRNARGGIAQAMDPVLRAVPAGNPPVAPENLIALLRAAWAGDPLLSSRIPVAGSSRQGTVEPVARERRPTGVLRWSA